jgi:hypothetical protein
MHHVLYIIMPLAFIWKRVQQRRCVGQQPLNDRQMTPDARQLKPTVVVLPPVITASNTLVRLGVTSAAAHNAHGATTYAGIVAVTDVRTTIGAVMTARLRHKPLNDLQVTVATG